MIKGKRSEKHFSKILFIIWCIIVFVLSVIPGDESPFPNITFIDKIAHFTEYLIFSLLYYLMRFYQQISYNRIIKELIFLSLLLPVLNEVIQIPIPGREFCLLDIVANFMGFLVMIIYLIVFNKKRTVVEK